MIILLKRSVIESELIFVMSDARMLLCKLQYKIFIILVKLVRVNTQNQKANDNSHIPFPPLTNQCLKFNIRAMSYPAWFELMLSNLLSFAVLTVICWNLNYEEI